MIRLAATISLLALAGGASAEQYRCPVGTRGYVVYQDSPCPSPASKYDPSALSPADQAQVRAISAENREFNDAILKVAPGMTTAAVDRLSPLVLKRGRVQSIDSAAGHTEWRTYDNGITLTIRNGVVDSVQH